MHQREEKNMSKRVPRLRTDDEAEKLLEKDLSDYIDPKHMVPLRFEFENKNSLLKIPAMLLAAIPSAGLMAILHYQFFILFFIAAIANYFRIKSLSQE